MTFDLNGKTFGLVSNDPNGEAGEKTLFHYTQQGHIVSARYSGGTIVHGSIAALLKGDLLNMVYHCITMDGLLKSGKATALLSWTKDGKIRMTLDWEWLEPNVGHGQSAYEEI